MAKARAGFHGPYGLGTGLNQLFRGMGGAGVHLPPSCTGFTGEEKDRWRHGSLLYENTAYPGRLDFAMAPQLHGEDGSMSTM